jgi:hypothetical protein
VDALSAVSLDLPLHTQRQVANLTHGASRAALKTFTHGIKDTYPVYEFLLLLLLLLLLHHHHHVLHNKLLLLRGQIRKIPLQSFVYQVLSPSLSCALSPCGHPPSNSHAAAAAAKWMGRHAAHQVLSPSSETLMLRVMELCPAYRLLLLLLLLLLLCPHSHTCPTSRPRRSEVRPALHLSRPLLVLASHRRAADRRGLGFRV